MLIKIGDCWVDPKEIIYMTEYQGSYNIFDSSVAQDGSCLQGPQLLITLRGAGSHTIKATMDEAEAALINAGVMADLTCDEPPAMTEAELAKLSELQDNGYKYLARDGDGKLFAYMAKPNSDGVGFYPSLFTEKATQVFETFNFLIPGAWLEIDDALNGWTL